jgi:hypothetical protein
MPPLLAEDTVNSKSISFVGGAASPPHKILAVSSSHKAPIGKLIRKMGGIADAGMRSAGWELWKIWGGAAPPINRFSAA